MLGGRLNRLATNQQLQTNLKIVNKLGASKDVDCAKEVNKEVYDFIGSDGSKYGICFWKPCNGIIHQIIFENYAYPGCLIIDTDSHPPNSGGVGSAEAVDGIASLPCKLKSPKVIGLHLTDKRNSWASFNNVIFNRLTGLLNGKGATGSIIEYLGPGVDRITSSGVDAICNMGAEIGAAASVSSNNNQMREHLPESDKIYSGEKRNYWSLGMDIGLSRSFTGLSHLASFNNSTSVFGLSTKIGVCHLSTRTTLEMTPLQKRKYPQVEQTISEEGYPILKFTPRPRNIFETKKKFVPRLRTYSLAKIREKTMPVDQDWPSVWPTAKTFVPSSVPLPIRQSYENKLSKVSREKYANTELLKIINFLHLTPEAIRRQCAAIKKFCTKWPENLDSDEEVRSIYPVTIITRDYCHSSNNIREHKARIVDLTIHLDDLKLQGRDRSKLIELSGDRYDSQTGILTIKTDACPMKIQNSEYAEYLLSALYFESQEHQSWEDERFDEEAFRNIDLNDYRKKVEEKMGLNKCL